MTKPSPERIAEEIIRRAMDRGVGKTICPSEVARAMADDWRALMPEVRSVAAILAARGLISVTQRGVQVDPEGAKGPIRLGIARHAD